VAPNRSPCTLILIRSSYLGAGLVPWVNSAFPARPHVFARANLRVSKRSNQLLAGSAKKELLDRC